LHRDLVAFDPQPLLHLNVRQGEANVSSRQQLLALSAHGSSVQFVRGRL
jgi:hypothetical protein